MSEAIVLESVSKTFGRGHTAVAAVRGVTLRVEAGTMVALAGPSGSGKTTLLNLMGGLDAPDAGRVQVDGHELSGQSEKSLSAFRRAHVGFVFQQFNLLADLTARENIELPLVLNRVAARERRRRVDALIERLGLTGRAGAVPADLSGGEQQRAAVARAVAHRPRLLLADEPTANLDSANARAVIELLGQIRVEEGITVVLTTHDARIGALADTRVRLEDGRIIKDHS